MIWWKGLGVKSGSALPGPVKSLSWRSGYYYQSVRDDRAVEDKLREYEVKLPTPGCPEYTKRIRSEIEKKK